MEICALTLIAALCIAGSIVIISGIVATIICAAARAVVSVFDSDIDEDEDDEIMEELHND